MNAKSSRHWPYDKSVQISGYRIEKPGIPVMKTKTALLKRFERRILNQIK